MGSIILLSILFYLKNFDFVSANDNTLPWRLPSHVAPLHYNLSLTPILEAGYENVKELGPQGNIPGKVSILVEIKNDTRSVVLHVGDYLAMTSTKVS